MDGDVDAVVFVARAGQGVLQTMRVGVRGAVLLLFESEEVVCCDAFDNVVSAGLRSHDRGDGDLLLLRQGGRRDGVVARLDLVQALNEDGEGNVVPGVAFGVRLEELSDVVVIAGKL